jgi:hypothetical protein
LALIKNLLSKLIWFVSLRNLVFEKNKISQEIIN